MYKLKNTWDLVREYKGISLDLIGTLFGSRSLLTERDPNKIRRSSEGDPKKYRRKPLGRLLDIRQKTTEIVRKNGELKRKKRQKSDTDEI